MTAQPGSFLSLQRWILDPSRFWLRASILAGVLCMSVALPLRFGPDRLILLLGLLVACAGVLLFLRLPELGLVTLIVNGLISPSPSLPGGLNFAVLHLLLLIGLWLLRFIVRGRDFQVVPSRANLPLVAMIGVAILSFVVGQLPWFRQASHAPLDAQIGGLLVFILAAGAFWLVANQIKDLRWLERMTWTLILLGALFVIGWVTPLGQVTSRLFPVGATANAIFWTWLAVMSFSQALLNDNLRWPWRLLAGAICVLTMYVAFVLQYDWKSAWLPPMAGLAAVFIARWPRFGIMMAIACYVPAELMTADAIASDEYSYSTRIDAWLIVLNMIKTNPILGFGPANYYWYTPLFRIRGYAVKFNSHNQYLDILAQTGILGLACVLWFFAEIGLIGWRLRNLAPRGFARAYVYGALGGLAGTVASGMLVDWFLPFAYNIGFTGFRTSIFAWMFLGGLVTIQQIVRKGAKGQV
jgi:O-antigen ligase